MSVVKFPLIPDARYRIRSADRKDPDLYLEWQKSGNVRAVALRHNDPRQEWNLRHEADGTYQIVNCGARESLSVDFYNSNGTPRYFLSSGGRQFWVFNSCGDDFIILNPNDGLCVDLAKDNGVILWERLDAPNQRWIIDSVEPLQPQSPDQPQPATDPNSAPSSATVLKAGNYRIVNPATNTEIVPYADSDTFVHIHGVVRDFNQAQGPGLYWTVTPQTGQSYFVTSGIPSTQGVYGYLSWVVGPLGLRCSKTQSACRLIPFSGRPNFFHIASQSDAQVIVARNDYFELKAAPFNVADERQLWQFIPV